MPCYGNSSQQCRKNISLKRPVEYREAHPAKIRPEARDAVALGHAAPVPVLNDGNLSAPSRLHHRAPRGGRGRHQRPDDTGDAPDNYLTIRHRKAAAIHLTIAGFDLTII
jgi:hypothetical protein